MFGGKTIGKLICKESLILQIICLKISEICLHLNSLVEKDEDRKYSAVTVDQSQRTSALTKLMMDDSVSTIHKKI